MPIPVTCACGKSMRVKDTFAGKKARCPACNAVLSIPDPAAEEPIEELPVVEPEDRPRVKAPQLDEPAPYRPGREPRLAGIPAERGRRRAPPVTFEPGWFGSINSGMVGGALMMVIAIVWFVVGLFAGYIFFYPPILFVIGLIALIKGLMGRT